MLARQLASHTFSEAEAASLLGDVGAPHRAKLLEGVRAESSERFVEALACVFRSIDWSKPPSVLEPHCQLVGFGCLDHLRIGNLLDLARRAAEPDASFAIDVVSALEFGDEHAAERVRERIRQKPTPEGLTKPPPPVLPLPEDPVGGLRAAQLLRPLLGESDEAQLRAAVELAIGAGNYAAHLVAAIARTRGIELPEEMVLGADHRRLAARLMVWLAATIGPSFGEELLLRVVEGAYWDDGDLEAYELPWTRRETRRVGDKLEVASQYGEVVLSARATFDPFDGPPPAKRRRWRISAKRAKARATPRALDAPANAPTYPQDGLDQRLIHEAGHRERVAELLRLGASPHARAAAADLSGQTALHRAATTSDCAEGVRRLLRAGADVEARWADQNAIDLLSARHESSARAADRLAAAGLRSERSGSLFAAAELGNHAFAAALLRAGAHADVVRDGKTPRAVALEHRNARTALVLGYF